MKTRIQVLSQGGRLIGVYVPPLNPPTDPRTPRAAMVAGPKQKLHEVAIEFEFSRAALRTTKQIEDLHAVLRKQLRLKK
jgi:hypothetical protein